MGPGFASRQSANQRGRYPAREEGRLERSRAVPRPGLHSQYRTRAAEPTAGPLPGVFPNLAACSPRRQRLDRATISSRSSAPAFPADGRWIPKLHRDTARRHAPTQHGDRASASPSTFGLLGGDTSGFPNGRRVADNVVAIELRAIAGVTLALVRPTYSPDGAAALLTDGSSNAEGYLTTFPYLQHPNGGLRALARLMALADAARGRPGYARRSPSTGRVSPTPWGHLVSSARRTAR